MKPVAIKDLKETVGRLAKQFSKATQQRLDVLRQSLNKTGSQDQKIAVPTWEGLEFILIKNVIRIESSSNYSRLVFANGESLLVTKQLKEFEELLTPYRFCRVQ